MNTRTAFLAGYEGWDDIKSASLPVRNEALFQAYPLLFDHSQEDETLAAGFDEYMQARLLASFIPSDLEGEYHHCIEELENELQRLKTLRDHPGFGTAYLRSKMYIFLCNNYHQEPVIDRKTARLLTRKVGVNTEEIIRHLQLSRKQEWADLYYRLSEQRLRFVRQLSTLAAIHLKLHALLQAPPTQGDPDQSVPAAPAQAAREESISVSQSARDAFAPRVFTS